MISQTDNESKQLQTEMEDYYGDAFKDVSTVPTLTLEPFQAEEEKKPAVQPEEPKAG